MNGYEWHVAAALAVVLVLILAVYYVRGRTKDGLLVSPEAIAVTNKSRKVFEDFGGRPPYEEFARRVKRDPVLFSQVRRLHRSDRLDPGNVQRNL